MTAIKLHFIYHNRHSGIEYQPGTLWFLDQAKSGGGTLMDRAPYEFSMLNDLLQPVRVAILCAWLANPTTALHLPSASIFDVEQHAAAALRYYLSDGNAFIMNYERASCTHSEERSSIELEGLEGSLCWQWPKLGTTCRLTHSYDSDGLLESKTLSSSLPVRVRCVSAISHFTTSINACLVSRRQPLSMSRPSSISLAYVPSTIARYLDNHKLL